MPQFDLSNPMIGGFVIPMLILAIVQAAKKLGGLQDRGAQVLAYGVGFVLYGLAFAMHENLIPEQLHIWVQLVVVCVAGPLIPMGFYSLVVKPTHQYLYNQRRRG